MKNAARVIEFYKRDRRLSVAVEGDKSFEFDKGVRRELRQAKKIERRNTRHEGKRELRQVIDGFFNAEDRVTASA